MFTLCIRDNQQDLLVYPAERFVVDLAQAIEDRGLVVGKKKRLASLIDLIDGLLLEFKKGTRLLPDAGGFASHYQETATLWAEIANLKRQITELASRSPG